MRLPLFVNGLPLGDSCPQPILIAGCLNLIYIKAVCVSVGEISVNILKAHIQSYVYSIVYNASFSLYIWKFYLQIQQLTDLIINLCKDNHSISITQQAYQKSQLNFLKQLQLNFTTKIFYENFWKILLKQLESGIPPNQPPPLAAAGGYPPVDIQNILFCLLLFIYLIHLFYEINQRFD